MSQFIRTERDHGIALFAAVWIVLVITILAIGVTRETRTTARIAGNEIAQAKARATAQAGLTWLAAALVAQARGTPLPQPPQEGRPGGPPRADTRRGIPLDGRPVLWRFNGTDVHLTVEAETGKLDLNRTDSTTLRSVLAGIAPGDVDRIATWIETKRRLDGRTTGVSWRIEDRGINRISDLAGELGEETYRALAPFLTVHGTQAPEPALATEGLFALLPLTEETRGRAEAARRGAPIDIQWPRRHATLSLSAEAIHRDGTRAMVRRLVRIMPGSDQPVLVLAVDG